LEKKLSNAARWQHFGHVADIGIRGTGATLADAFEQAGLALTAVVTRLELVQPRQRIELSVQNSDRELLFFDWLNALIFEMATRKMLFCRFKVEVDAGQLRASAWGEPVSIERHHPAVEIKGATLTELKVAQRVDESWIAQCVLDV
jgi:SHS2 domain-containing protein